MATPSTNGANGRTAAGRFTAGNKLGLGNPYAKRTAALRGLLFDTVTDDDLRAIVAKLVEMAKSGDLAAARETERSAMGRYLQDHIKSVGTKLIADPDSVADDRVCQSQEGLMDFGPSIPADA